MKKKIKRFQRLAKIRKKDISKDINNSNLVQNEINKNDNLIEKIKDIMEVNKNTLSNRKEKSFSQQCGTDQKKP